MTIKTFFTTLSLSLLCGLIHGQNIWTPKATFTGNFWWQSVGFSIGDKGYVGTGTSSPGTMHNEFWQYDTTSNTWLQKASLPVVLEEAVGFSIGNKGYIGTGDTAFWKIHTNQFFEYDPTNNSWTPKANFGGTPRDHAFAFSVNGKGYIGGGDDSQTTRNDLWEYDPTNDTWTQKANMPISGMSGAIAFTINNKAYVGVGLDSSGYSKLFFEYNPTTDTWNQKTNFGGSGRWEAVAFSIGNYGYVGTGLDANDLHDFWQYNPTNDSWLQVNNFPGSPRYDAIGFAIGNSGYLGIGSNGMDFYKFSPPTIVGIQNLSNNLIQIKISPNPFSLQTVLQTDYLLKNATLTVRNCFGQIVKQINNISGQTIILHRDNLSSGIYLMCLTQDSKVIATDKLIITD